ncbi:hypothetical protein PENSPDRAFT_215797 [Peniophora sp. CONT]|nr:hypothetical protein PENSPDRAFT_215797 [Peniophora sp. CONT]
MDPATHSLYDGIIMALSAQDQGQVARDLRRQHMQVLRDNALLRHDRVLLEAHCAVLQRDLQNERQEHTDKAARTSHEHNVVIANLQQQLVSANVAQHDLELRMEQKLQEKSSSLAEALADLAACREALHLERIRADNLANAQDVLRSPVARSTNELHLLHDGVQEDVDMHFSDGGYESSRPSTPIISSRSLVERDAQLADEPGAEGIPGAPLGQQTRKSSASALAGLSSAILETTGVDKLSVRCFVDDDTVSTIWDRFCKTDLPPLVHDGTVYEIGDFVLFRNHWNNAQTDAIPEGSNHVLDAWVGIISDYGSKDLSQVASDDPDVHPATVEGEVIEWVAIMWLFSQSDIAKYTKRKVQNHLHIKIVNSDNFKDTFFSSDFPDKLRFFSTEVEWMRVGDLWGHLPHHNIGCTEDSGRAIIVNWTGPVLDHDQIWRRYCRPRKGGRLVRTYAVKAGTGIGDAEFPEGWVSEG